MSSKRKPFKLWSATPSRPVSGPWAVADELVFNHPSGERYRYRMLHSIRSGVYMTEVTNLGTGHVAETQVL